LLQKLSIQNYAIIDELEIEFSGKLNIITGETGAGKSIIVGALGLILGERADSSVLVSKEKKCIVEGIFHADGRQEIRRFLKENELDIEENLVLRREITVNGKSRAFINDTPVNLDQLRSISSTLVDLHQQFDTLQLAESDFQRQVLDALAGQFDLVADYQQKYFDWQRSKKELSELQRQKTEFDKEAGYNQFQFNELEQAAFKENELEELDGELKLLNNSENIKAVLSKVNYELNESETPVVQQLRSLVNQLQNISPFHSEIQGLIQRLQSAQVELRDIADETDRLNSQVNYDPEKIQQMDERLSFGYKLLKKHGVKTTNELLVIQSHLQEKLNAVLDIDEMIRMKEEETGEKKNLLLLLAAKISEARKKQTKPLQKKVNELLLQVGMPNAQLLASVETHHNAALNKETSLNEFGCDEIEFLFDANKSGQFQALRKVASGGELSRLMLCIKSLVAKSMDLPSLIFDEIDTGISGEAARQVGIIMKELAANRQVICITHQPQLAGKADAHYFVYKQTAGDKVKTNIRQLDKEERVTVIAKMLGGDRPTAAAIENAKEMMIN
jgi:DNA repair protein RecN (Recombination protein N)